MLFRPITSITLICLLAGCHASRIPFAQPPAVPFAPFLEQAAHTLASTQPPRPPSSGPETPSKGTLDQLEQLALDNNPSLAESRAWVEAARGKWVQVGLPPNTVLGYSGQQLGSGGTAEQQGLFIGQEFIRGDKLDLNRSVAFHEIQKAEKLWAMQRQRVLTDIRLAYYQVLVAQRRNDTTGELVKIAQLAVETAETLLNAKEVSRVDVMRSRIELQATQLQLKNARSLSVAAWSRLVAVTGGGDMQPRQLDGDLENLPGHIDAIEALARLVSESPEMGVASSDVERARRAVDRARAETVSNVDFQAIFQSDRATGSSNANLQVSIPIPSRNRNEGGIQQARAEVIAAERSLDRLELNFQQRLAGVYHRYTTARNQAEDYSRNGGILANSGAALELIRKGYEAGEMTYLDLNTAQRTYSQTTLAYIESLGALWAAVIEIEGLLLKGSLENDSLSPWQ